MQNKIEILNVHTRCRTCAASCRIFHFNIKCNYLSGKYGGDKKFLSFIGGKWNRSRHLIFWSLGTLTGLRDRVRGLIA